MRAVKCSVFSPNWCSFNSAHSCCAFKPFRQRYCRAPNFGEITAQFSGSYAEAITNWFSNRCGAHRDLIHNGVRLLKLWNSELKFPKLDGTKFKTKVRSAAFEYIAIFVFEALSKRYHPKQIPARFVFVESLCLLASIGKLFKNLALNCVIVKTNTLNLHTVSASRVKKEEKTENHERSKTESTKEMSKSAQNLRIWELFRLFRIFISAISEKYVKTLKTEDIVLKWPFETVTSGRPAHFHRKEIVKRCDDLKPPLTTLPHSRTHIHTRLSGPNFYKTEKLNWFTNLRSFAFEVLDQK